MTIESIGVTQSPSQGQLQQKTIGQDDLFKILLTQLTYQDPLKPLDNQEFIAQLAQFSSLEQNRQINTKLDSMLNAQSGDQAVYLLGHDVEVRTDTGSTIGNVTAVTFDQGVPVLTVKDGNGQYMSDISLSQVYIVR